MSVIPSSQQLTGICHRQALTMGDSFSIMSRPFESFEFLNRGWDVRLLEGLSLRKVFALLLLDAFILGALTLSMIYEAFRFHRFGWANAMIFLTLALSVFRYTGVVYRRLDS
jgi:hypothetical protein